MACLLAAAENSAETVRGLTGPERAQMYVFSASIGFRVSGAAALKMKMFDLNKTREPWSTT